MTMRFYKEELKWTPSDPSVKRALGDDPVPAPGHSAASVPENYKEVHGWGADLDPANRPMVPRELPSDVTTVRGNVGARQVPTEKVHVSIEHPDLTPVFGNSCPPHGLSGMLRDYAFQFGEASNRHWMTLILADRVDMVEHLFGDALRGKPDNYIKEKGWPAYLKYNPGRNRRWLTLGALALGAVAVGVAVNQWRGRDD
ncbi:MAG TPA: hypothetical protein VE974_03815 [Thermoanaerobaculia bacterium]|nr:hypothetical protein [Thermoanaerobaculia bacterium]